MANSVDPDQTAPIGAVCSGSTLLAPILNLSVILGNYLSADDFSRRHFKMHFFLGALRVNTTFYHRLQTLLRVTKCIAYHDCIAFLPKYLSLCMPRAILSSAENPHMFEPRLGPTYCRD